MKKTFLTLLTLLLLGGATFVWGDPTEETISLASHTLTDGVVVLNSTSGNATLTSNMATNIKDNNYDPRGVRWQYTNKYIQVTVAEGHKINSITLTSNKNGNSVTSLTYTLTDGSSALSGSWDNAPNSGKQNTYTWTASSGTYYRTWKINKTNDTGDIYLSAVTINYEEASVSNTAPSIETQPASTLDAYVGFEATLSIAASGYPAPTYQWYSCSNTEKADSEEIDGETNSSYTFTPDATGTFYYYCVATNNYGGEDHTATSNVSTVTVGTKYSVAYNKGETGATVSNTLPLAYYAAGTSITLPKNHYFYLAGSSVTKWNDGTNDHDFNSSHTVNANVTFYPVFATNTKALGDEATTITWTFSRDAGAPFYAIEGDGKSCSVIGTTANGIDLKMDVTLSKSGSDVGKFNNTAYTNRAQVNKYTSFTIPAVSGMVVTYVGTSGTASTNDEVLFGEDKATSVDGSTYSYTYNGSETTLTITDNKSGMYPSGISVSYPAAVLPPSFSPASGSDVAIGDNITITDNAGGATIYYQWDGSPADAAAVVSGGLTGTSISTSSLSEGSHTLYAVARKNDENSILASATYTLADPVPSVTFTCTSKTFTPNVAGTGITLNSTSSSQSSDYHQLKNNESITITTGSGKVIKEIEVTYNRYGTKTVLNVIGTTTSAYSVTSLKGSWEGTAYQVILKGTNDSSSDRVSAIKVIYEEDIDEIAVSTLAGRNYASYIAVQKLDFGSTDGITAYIATGLNGASDAVVISPISIVPAGTPIIVKTNTKGATVNVPVTTGDADDVSGNKLIAGDGTAYNAVAGRSIYYLAGDEFHLANAGTLQSGKAYLAITSGGGAPSLHFEFDEENNATDVETIEANEKAVKFIQNGRLLIMRDGITYDAMGRVIR